MNLSWIVMNSKTLATAVLCVAFCTTGCRKETSQGPSQPSYIAMRVDSCMVQAPNLVTPNADGVNDVFTVMTMNVASLRTTILNAAGDTSFYSDALAPVWSDLDSSDQGHYRVHVKAISTSGITLLGNAPLAVMYYPYTDCLSYTGIPVTGDQFDPREWGLTYPSQEHFCP